MLNADDQKRTKIVRLLSLKSCRYVSERDDFAIRLLILSQWRDLRTGYLRTGEL